MIASMFRAHGKLSTLSISNKLVKLKWFHDIIELRTKKQSNMKDKTPAKHRDIFRYKKR